MPIMVILAIAVIVGMVLIIIAIQKIEERGWRKYPSSLYQEEIKKYNEKNSYSKETKESYNNYIEIKIGSVIIHPNAIKELGDAGRKMLEASSIFYDKERGVLVLEGKTREEISSQRIKQLLPKLLNEDD